MDSSSPRTLVELRTCTNTSRMSSAGPSKPPSLRQCLKCDSLQASSGGSGDHRLDWAGPPSSVSHPKRVLVILGAVQPLELVLHCRQHHGHLHCQLTTIKQLSPSLAERDLRFVISPPPHQSPSNSVTPLWLKDLKLLPGRLEESPCTNIERFLIKVSKCQSKMN